MLVQLGLCAEFLRCNDVKKLVRTCKDVDDIQVLSLKTKKAAAEKELNQDIRDEAAAKRARHVQGDFTPSDHSEYSFGFSIDSDGHWLEHDPFRPDQFRKVWPVYTNGHTEWVGESPCWAYTLEQSLTYRRS